jgi:preprotein translocase subunit SecF
MLRLLHDTHYDFIRWWRWAAGLTIAFIILGIGSLAIKGVNYSIEFTGGTLMQLEFAKPIDVGELRGSLDAAGIKGTEIQQFGSNREFTIRTQEAEKANAATSGAETVAKQIQNLLVQKYGPSNVHVIRTEAVGAKVGDELQRDAVIAMLLSFLVTTIYLQSGSSGVCCCCSHSDRARRVHHAGVHQAAPPRGFADCRCRNSHGYWILAQ